MICFQHFIGAQQQTLPLLQLPVFFLLLVDVSLEVPALHVFKITQEHPRIIPGQLKATLDNTARWDVKITALVL